MSINKTCGINTAPLSKMFVDAQDRSFLMQPTLFPFVAKKRGMLFILKCRQINEKGVSD